MATVARRVYGEPGSLYARCGGVFGISAFVDRCMDRWMADTLLNQNPMVTRWHLSAQRPGFKFLVTQLMCSLAGGPQQYTGRPMAESHKHLNISATEWARFMDIFGDVCSGFGVPAKEQDELTALLVAMKDDCVIAPGEKPPPDPGEVRPTGESLYARVGGAYPLALFVDRLVDALLSDDRVAIPIDGTKRNEASLKYLAKELICQLAGGPEVVTCAEAEETRLLVPKAAWPIVKTTARHAADHIGNSSARKDLLALLDVAQKAIVDPHSKEEPVNWWTMVFGARGAQVKSKEESAAGAKLLSKAVINARHAGSGASVAARKRAYGDPRTLYGKGGGVFGLARLSHILMEAWMADPTLNANKLVAKWHESGQKAGFKFLVTQLIGYQTGGPQRYTGRDMRASHLHLGISQDEWDVFIAVAAETLTEAKVPAAAARGLLDILRRCRRHADGAMGVAPQPRDACPRASAPPRPGGRLTNSDDPHPACARVPRLSAQLRDAVRAATGHARAARPRPRRQCRQLRHHLPHARRRLPDRPLC